MLRKIMDHKCFAGRLALGDGFGIRAAELEISPGNAQLFADAKLLIVNLQAWPTVGQQVSLGGPYQQGRP